MSLIVPLDVIRRTSSPKLERHRNGPAFGRQLEVEVEADIDSDALSEIAAVARELNRSRVFRAADAILQARQGMFDKPVPNFDAFMATLVAFLSANPIDHWVYIEGADGLLYPYLVQSVSYETGKTYNRQKNDPYVEMELAAYGHDRHSSDRRQAGKSVGYGTRSVRFRPQQVVRRRVADALALGGIYKETPSLKENYLASMNRYREKIAAAFSEKLTVTGRSVDERRGGEDSNGHRKAIHDLHPAELSALPSPEETRLTPRSPAVLCTVPEHPVVRVFDLKTHDYYWVHSDHLEPHEYDASLAGKIVLPESHRDLLDILTTDVSAFTADIVEGKSAGNVILCKGQPGVGKTLTAEVYAELIKRPLYSIHTGTLGTTASKIKEELELAFKRAKRWNAVLLLDEADVFVLQRGNDVEQNAIVAEFLRTLEYFDGLMFMTTNRPDDIDEALISRCAAIIGYDVPTPDLMAKVWRVMSDQFEAGLNGGLIDELAKAFPAASPRDIKMLLRLVLRVAKGHKEPLSLDLFRRCAMFRAVEYVAPEANAA